MTQKKKVNQSGGRGQWLLLLVVMGFGIWYWWPQPATGWPVVNAPPRAGAIVAFGDSLTAGDGASPGRDYPSQLAGLIGRPVINSGRGGDTVEQAQQRVQNDVLLHQPGVVIVLLGGNDLLRRLDMDEAMRRLETIVRQIQAGGAMVALVGLENVVPMSGIEKRYEKVAKDTRALYVPNILSGIFGHADRMSDQIHPNDAGYTIVAQRIANALKPYLKPQ